MSFIINSVLNATFGLLWKKVRDRTANTLEEGDLTDEKCRKMIVRELDDIKSKLDGLARKDLLSSVSFLKEGVCLLNMSLEKSMDDETRQDNSQAEAVVDGASPFAISQAIGRLKIASEERFASAKASFKAAREKATEAFSNKSLDIEDKILATKLRMASRILENLEDPDAAAGSCKLYLEELHAMPAVQEIFSVHVSGGMKARFSKTKRLENVQSVTMINSVLFDFTEKFTKLPLGVFNWPAIELGKRTYYPLYDESEIFTKMKESGVKSPYQYQLTSGVGAEGDTSSSAVNSKREIIIKSREHRGSVYVINSTGAIQSFCSLPTEDTEVSGFYILSLAIDGEDNVYIATRFEQTDNVYNYKLFVFDAKGNIEHELPLEFLSGKDGLVNIAVNKDKKIIIHEGGEGRVYVCDISGQLQCSFPLQMNFVFAFYITIFLSISDKNEIIAAPECGNTVYIYTEEGNLKRKIKLPKGHGVRGVAFNHITKKVIVGSKVRRKESYHLLSYSETGEIQALPLLHDAYDNDKINSHPNGPVALVHNDGVIFI